VFTFGQSGFLSRFIQSNLSNLAALVSVSGPSNRAEASRMKGKYMRIHGAALELKPRNPCPVCGVETALAEVEPHPLHVDFEIHGYHCEQCGPIKSLVVFRSSVLRNRH
jgi:hypothetical protein